MALLAGLDWATTAAIIVALAAVAGLLLQFFKRERPWKKSIEEHNLRLTSIEIKIENFNDNVDSLKSALEDHESRDNADFIRIENKIEKLTDLMIDMLGSKTKTTSRKK